jgi:hypothetical protein
MVIGVSYVLSYVIFLPGDLCLEFLKFRKSDVCFTKFGKNQERAGIYVVGLVGGRRERSNVQKRKIARNDKKLIDLLEERSVQFDRLWNYVVQRRVIDETESMRLSRKEHLHELYYITKSPSRKKATIKNQKFPPDFVAIIWYYPRTVFWMFSEISARLRGNYRV